MIQEHQTPKFDPIEYKARVNALEGADTRLVPIDISKGWTANTEPAPGYWHGINMAPLNDVGWRCRSGLVLSYNQSGPSIYNGWTLTSTGSGIYSNGSLIPGAKPTQSGKWADLGAGICAFGSIDGKLYEVTTSKVTLKKTLFGPCCCEEHQNRLVYSSGSSNQLFYSISGDYWKGLDDDDTPGEEFLGKQYVNVGNPGDPIVDIVEANGFLYIFKKRSIWLKSSWGSEMVPQSFRELGGAPASVYSACKAGNYVAYCNAAGVFLLSAGGGQSQYISAPIEDSWRTWFSAGWVGYSPGMEMLFCSPSGSSESSGPLSNTVCAFDLNTQKWLCINSTYLSARYGAITTNNIRGIVLCGSSMVVLSPPSIYPPLDPDSSCITTATDNGTAVPQRLVTHWENCGTFLPKTLGRVFFEGKNITKLTVYYRSGFGQSVSSTVYNSPSSGLMTDSIIGNDFRLQFEGAGNMLLKSVVIEVHDHGL